MNDVRLVKPQLELEEEYLSFYQEWKESGENMVPWVISKDPSDFLGMLKELSNQGKGIGVKEGWVPDSTFWLVDNHHRVLGAANIRHQLTEHLYNAGGHIGYGIRPSARLRGYATKLLELSLIEAKKLGINDVLVVCDAGNVGSERTIIKNGGRPDTDYIEEDGNVVKRYWIKNT
ncbi:GNAT family N-acetyltransferase [Paenibacillus sp. NPDC093718]|uniref:GNAT family N-acetyltransferase n=1 Tax=Paenibacillus sp. NPDC093718 TaxID=3390601 RepID=UPI003D056BB8